MPVAKPGPHPVFTEDFLVKLRPDQRAALDAVAEVTGQSRSEALRRFIDQGFIAFQFALEAVHRADRADVAAALESRRKENRGNPG